MFLASASRHAEQKRRSQKEMGARRPRAPGVALRQAVQTHDVRRLPRREASQNVGLREKCRRFPQGDVMVQAVFNCQVWLLCFLHLALFGGDWTVVLPPRAGTERPRRSRLIHCIAYRTPVGPTDPVNRRVCRFAVNPCPPIPPCGHSRPVHAPYGPAIVRSDSKPAHPNRPIPATWGPLMAPPKMVVVC